MSVFLRRGVTSLIMMAGLLAGSGQAGIYYSGEEYAPLPSRWRGFLADHQRLANISRENPRLPAATSLRGEYLAVLAHLRQTQRRRPLTADESADLGAVLLRLGKTREALAVLNAAARYWPEHFAVQANLAAAWHRNGEIEQAIFIQTDVVRRAPPRWRPYEELYLKLLRARRNERPTSAPQLDDLFGIPYERHDKPAQDQEIPRFKEAICGVQQLTLWFPEDGRLLWHAGELAFLSGDTLAAAAIIETCVTEYGLDAPLLRVRRRQLRPQWSLITSDHRNHMSANKLCFVPASPRPLGRTVHPQLLPPIVANRPYPLTWNMLAAAVADPKGRPQFPTYLQKLQGVTVQIPGCVQPLNEGPEVTRLVLLEYPTGCWLCESPEPNGMVYVELARPVPRPQGMVQIVGRLRLNVTEPEQFWFQIEDGVLGEAQ